MFDTLGTTNWPNVGQCSAERSNTGTSRTADGQHSRPGSHRLTRAADGREWCRWRRWCRRDYTGVSYAGQLCQRESAPCVRNRSTQRDGGKKPRRSGFALELFPIWSPFQVRFPHLDIQRTQLADVCVGKILFVTGN